MFFRYSYHPLSGRTLGVFVESCDFYLLTRTICAFCWIRISSRGRVFKLLFLYKYFILSKPSKSPSRGSAIHPNLLEIFDSIVTLFYPSRSTCRAAHTPSSACKVPKMPISTAASLLDLVVDMHSGSSVPSWWFRD